MRVFRGFTFFCTFFCMLLVIFALGMAFGQDTNFATGPQYLATSGSSLFARPIATPTLSLTAPPLEVGAGDATGVLTPGAEDQTVLPPQAVSEPVIDLLPTYYGERPVSVVDINSPGESNQPSFAATLPSNFLDTGVELVTTTRALRDRGYGVPLAEAAAHMKARSHSATHVYTNADIDRLQGGSR
jgi:hypothetical protein